MDKRFLLALALTGIVVVLTPLLFPSSRQLPAPATADSARGDSVTAITPERDADVTAPLSGSIRAPDSLVSSAPDSLPRANVPRAETLTVRTPLAEYGFSTVGAMLTSARMLRYRALDGSEAPVELARDGQPLIGFGIVAPGDTVDLRQVLFTATRASGRDGRDTLSFQATVQDADVRIRYTVVPDSYVVRVSGSVASARGGAGYLLVHLPSGFNSAEADSVEDQQHLSFAAKPVRAGAEGIPFRKLDPGERQIQQGPLTWVVAKSKYFLVGALAAASDEPFAELNVVGGPRTGRVPSQASGVAVQPLKAGTFSFEIYAGPQEWRRLVAMGRDFENSNPYGGFMQPIVQPFATIVMRILLWMKDATKLSYGWVLVIFGLAIRLLLWPLNQSAMRTSIKMQRLQPELADVQKRHKADPQKLQSEMMRIYRDHGMSPFSSLSGCLPMLLPMPILFALFFVFQNTIEFRGVPFFWLPDISLKDPLYIMPLLMGLTMFLLSWIGMRNVPPNPQTKMMAYVMPIMMTVFLINFASGLNLYYAVQNLAALPQQWLLANERAKTSTRPAKAT